MVAAARFLVLWCCVRKGVCNVLFLEGGTARLAILFMSIFWLVGDIKAESAREVIGSEVVGLRTHLRFECCEEWCCVVVHFVYVCDAGEVG